MEYIEQLKKAVIEGDEDLAIKLANDIIKGEIDVKKALMEGLREGMREVGQLYEKHGTPKENIMAFIKAAKKYGKFPIKTNN